MSNIFFEAIGCQSIELVSQIKSKLKLEKYIALSLRKVDPVFLITEVASNNRCVPTPFSKLDKFGQRAIITSICGHIRESVKASK